MNPFLLSPRERLADWKRLRQELSAKPESEQLAEVARYWAQAPTARFAYDAERPDTWPTPWEMISEGDWCRNSVGIGMEFTLRLSGWSQDRLKLLLWKDHDISDMALVVEIDGTHLLNYDYGVVVPVPNTRREIICSWSFNGKLYVSSAH